MSRRIDPESPSVWPKNLVPPPKSRYEKLKIRDELLLPDVLPDKALAASRLSNPDILYEIDEPGCSLDDQEAVSPISRSSTTLVGDAHREDGQSSSNIIDQLVEAAYHQPSMGAIELSSTITETPPLTPTPHTPPSHALPPRTPPSHALPRRKVPRHRLLLHLEPRHSLPPHALSPLTLAPHMVPPHTLSPHMPDSTRKDRLMTTASKQPHWAPRPPPGAYESLTDEQNVLVTVRPKRPRLDSNQPPCAYESLPNDQNVQDDHECSSDHYNSSDVSECWEEKRARHFKETMFPDRTKKHKVGTHAYYYSFHDFPSTPPEVLAKRDPRIFMSGALQSEERSPSRDLAPIARRNIKSIKVPTPVKVAPLCICRTPIPGAERYGGHYHAINGISTRRGKLYFDCVRLCSEKSGDIVNIECPVLKKQCPKLVSFILPSIVGSE